MGGLMTWYMSTGTVAVPGCPVALPVTVECGVLGATHAAWHEAWCDRCEAWAVAPPQAATAAPSKASHNDLAAMVLTRWPAYRFQRR
jgi:hypothetical protein